MDDEHDRDDGVMHPHLLVDGHLRKPQNHPPEEAFIPPAPAPSLPPSPPAEEAEAYQSSPPAAEPEAEEPQAPAAAPPPAVELDSVQESDAEAEAAAATRVQARVRGANARG